jgi:hypothetical protein
LTLSWRTHRSCDEVLPQTDDILNAIGELAAIIKTPLKGILREQLSAATCRRFPLVTATLCFTSPKSTLPNQQIQVALQIAPGLGSRILETTSLWLTPVFQITE